MDRTLVIFPGALGDLICAIPALKAIARDNQGSTLELMARAGFASFAVGRIAGIARAHSIDRREVAALFAPGDVPPESRDFFGSFSRIHSFFATDDPQFRDALVEANGRAVEFHRFRPEGHGHVSRLYLQSVSFSDEPLDGSINLLSADIAEAEALGARNGFRPSEYVVVFPGSGSPLKNWPAANFEQLAVRLSRPAVVVLGPAEAALVNSFPKDIVIQDLELGVVAALARLSAAFVGNDSGVSHLAAAAGARGVVLFGPTDPERWSPPGSVTTVRHEPIEAITVEEVVAALRLIT